MSRFFINTYVQQEAFHTTQQNRCYKAPAVQGTVNIQHYCIRGPDQFDEEIFGETDPKAYLVVPFSTSYQEVTLHSFDYRHTSGQVQTTT